MSAAYLGKLWVWTQIKISTERRAWSRSKLFDTLIVFLKECFEKLILKNVRWRQKKSWKITQHMPLWLMRYRNILQHAFFLLFNFIIHVLDKDQIWPYYYMGLYARKPFFAGFWTTKAQFSLCIHTVWSAPLLFAYRKVSYQNLLQMKFHYSC